MAMTDRPTGMLGDVLGFLRNYYVDIDYQHYHGGIEYLNSNTHGTPGFQDDAEFKRYASQLETTIKMLEDNK